jgi:hypothetical protein
MSEDNFLRVSIVNIAFFSPIFSILDVMSRRVNEVSSHSQFSAVSVVVSGCMFLLP